MTTATLTDIITKTRKLTGTGNSLQLTDSIIIDHINSFYLYDFPSEFRSLQLKNTFTFNTVQNKDTYMFDFIHYSTLEQPAYINKRLVPLYTNPANFFTLFFNWQQTEVLDVGDGTMGPYAGTVQTIPIVCSVNNNPMVETKTPPIAAFGTGTYPTPTIPPTAVFSEPNIARSQNILITANTATSSLRVTDDGNGNLIGDVTAGTINYITGAVANLTFNAVVPDGNDIEIFYNPSSPSWPQAILFWQNQLTLKPVPDKAYTVEIVAYRRPSQVLLGSANPEAPVGTGVPELLEWWECLAAGASKKIFEERQDEDGIQMMDKMLFERYALAETRTYAQLGKQQIGTIYSDQLHGFGGGFPGWGGNNG